MQPDHPSAVEPDAYSIVPQPATPPPPQLASTTADDLAPILDDSLPGGLALSSVGKKVVNYLLETFLIVITLGFGWLVWAAIVASKGQTPARQLLGMRVVSTRDGRPLSFPQMLFMRGIIGGVVHVLAVGITLGIMLLMPLWDRRNQTIVDKVSGSVVLDDPHKVLG